MRCLAPRSAERGDAPSPCSLIGWAISQQYPERQEWPDRNELLVHEVFLRERQAFHEGSRLRHVLAVQQEDDALAVAAREPLLNCKRYRGTVARISAGMIFMICSTVT